MSSARLTVEVGLRSDPGGRPSNEDYAAMTDASAPVPPQGVAIALADGVGGRKGGRVAAELSVRTFLEAHQGLDPLRGAKRNGIAGLQAANSWLHTIGQTDPDLTGMSCTFTALILHGRQAHVFHVGDSRLYRLREGILTRITTDHVPPRSALRNRLTRALGAEAELRVDYEVESARVHDRYLICSDGVHGGLSDRAIRDELTRGAAPQGTVDRLVQAALDARIGDNATAVLIDIIALPEPNQFDLRVDLDALPIMPPPRSEMVVDGYRLGTILADGQYSRVFQGVDETSGAKVIVKFPKPRVGAEPILRHAFLREAWIAARLQSPFVAEVIEPRPGRRTSLYTVMPRYEGETLEQRLRRTPAVSRFEGLAIADKMAKGVVALHRAGVIHRDIKPENVILTPDGGLRILDLGVARLPNMEDANWETTPGTPSYMAPELFNGQAGDELSDLYALGVTVYRLFSGGYPYGEVEPFSRPRFSRPPVPLSTHRPDLPSWLDVVIRRAIAVAPRDRWADALEFAFALEHGQRQTIGVPDRLPLIERDPVRFWQIVAALLALLLVLSLLHQVGGLG